LLGNWQEAQPAIESRGGVSESALAVLADDDVDLAGAF
jgi:hypothetical protein